MTWIEEAVEAYRKVCQKQINDAREANDKLQQDRDRLREALDEIQDDPALYGDEAAKYAREALAADRDPEKP